jgi:uncharacterized protein YndB with AHSA1/START domain
MNKTAALLKIVRHLSHEPERVFSALTDPAKISQWFRLPNGRTKVTSELRPGGKYVLEMRNDEKTSTAQGVYLEIVPPRRLVFTWDSCNGVTNTKVTIELSPSGDGTDLVLTHELPEDAVQGHREGWKMCFDNFETFLDCDTSNAPFAGAKDR